MTNTQANTLHLGYSDVMQSGNDVLVIMGDNAMDSVVLEYSYKLAGQVEKDGQLFNDYVMSGSRGTGHALIENGLQVVDATTL